MVLVILQKYCKFFLPSSPWIFRPLSGRIRIKRNKHPWKGAIHEKLLFILTLILSGLLWYVMVPAAPTPSAGRPPLMESFSYPYLGKKLPRPLRLCYLAYHMKDVAKERIDKSDWVSLDNMPAYLPQALIATEDRRFYSHIGIDPSAIMRAVLVNLQYDEVAQGGSTLTQQLVKNNLLSPERSLERKLWEAGLALIVEARYSKEEILEMYFNTTFLVTTRQASEEPREITSALNLSSSPSWSVPSLQACPTRRRTSTPITIWKPAAGGGTWSLKICMTKDSLQETS